jgi:hypothetical protein
MSFPIFTFSYAQYQEPESMNPAARNPFSRPLRNRSEFPSAMLASWLLGNKICAAVAMADPPIGVAKK